MTYLWIESVYGMGFLSKNLNCRVSINGYCATACWKEEVERKVSAPISRSKLTLNNPCSYTPLVIQDIIFPTTTIHCFGMIYISAKSKADFELINKTSKPICWKNLKKQEIKILQKVLRAKWDTYEHWDNTGMKCQNEQKIKWNSSCYEFVVF